MSDAVPEGDLTEFAVAIADKYKPECIVAGDPVQSYRNYYTKVKSKTMDIRWKDLSTRPEWWPT
jgi:hypothetical protein